MKKLIIFLAFTSFVNLHAQTKLRLGVCADPIITWFNPVSKSLQRDGARLGFNGGLVLETYFKPNYAFVSGLTITSIGGNLMYNDTVTINTNGNERVKINPGTTVAYNLKYITIPLALKLKTNEIGYFTYYAQLGFTAQVNIGSRANSSDERLSRDNVSHEINLMNMSYFFGAGLEYNIGGQTSINGGLFYNNGFIDALSNNRYKANINYLTMRLGVIF